MYKKMFLVAIGGKSVDGRDLPNEDIFALAENYNPEIYTAGIVYDFSHFQNVVGTVKYLTAKMVAGKARLYAEVVVSEELLETAENWTQPYYFALAVQYGSGKPLPSPYLVNLATNPKAAFDGIDTISYSALKAC
ncbi:MAG: GPO family capsid scaffolding protein [Hafnia alvei]|uniref:GPO family capsid scaffolding protein n=1 Tax=Hafnia alvei TaxID=569 RepID=UPI003F919FF6